MANVGLSIDVLSKLGFKVEPAFDKAAYCLNYYGVKLELAQVELARARSVTDLLNVVRSKYRRAGGAMKVQVVRVNGKKGQALCQQIEAWPGDYRWKCGSCLAWGAWVQPTLGALCAKRCGAMVVYVERRNLFDQQLIDQYEEGVARQYFTWMDDGVRMAKLNTGADFSDGVKEYVDRAAMKEAADREAVEQERRKAEMAALDAKLIKAREASRAREAELMQNMRKDAYEEARRRILMQQMQNMPGPMKIRQQDFDAMIAGTIGVGITPLPYATEMIEPEPKKKKKEKKPKPKPIKITGPRRFRSDFNDE